MKKKTKKSKSSQKKKNSNSIFSKKSDRIIATICAVVIATGAVLGIFMNIDSCNASRKENKLMAIFPVKREFHFSDYQFNNAYIYYRNGNYRAAYNEIKDTMRSFKRAYEGIDNTYAEMDEIIADKCLFYGDICIQLGNLDEASDYLYFCYNYLSSHDDKHNSYGLLDMMASAALYIAYVNYYLNIKHEDTIKMLIFTLNDIKSGPADDSFHQIERNIIKYIGAIYSDIGMWQEAIILFSNSIFPYTVAYADFIIPQDTKFNINKTPLYEQTVVDFLSDIFPVDDDIYNIQFEKELDYESRHPGYIEYINSDANIAKQADLYRNAKIFMVIFSMLELKDGLSDEELINVIEAYANISSVLLVEFGNAVNIIHYMERAASLLNLIEITDGNKFNFAATYSLTSTAYFNLVSGIPLIEFNEEDVNLLNNGMLYYYYAMNFSYELLSNLSDDAQAIFLIATTYINTGLALSRVDEGFDDTVLNMFAKACNILSNINSSYANNAKAIFMEMYREKHPIKALFGFGYFYIRSTAKTNEVINIVFEQYLNK